ncbi:MAG: type II secretion system protein GspK [Candidatus Omnitrophica bacterium]|nr:type II secretion system protein GspK [Candidatus Omnitrophota bacterium]
MLLTRKTKAYSTRASVLIIVLWILAFLTMLVVNLGFMVRSQLQFARHLQDRMKMYYIARAGIEKAIVELYEDESPSCDTLNESWANKGEFFDSFQLGGGFFTVSYSSGGKNQEDEDAFVLYGAMDESGRIDINSAQEDIIVNLLERVGGMDKEDAIDTARCIADWRDKDVALSVGGAENDYYQGLSSPYECKNGKFQVAEELLLVKGMNEEVFSRIRDVITVYDTEKVNINTAGFKCLYALGLESGLCEDIIEYRNGGDGVPGTEDDPVFNSPSELMNIGSLFTEEAAQINTLISRNILMVRSNTFRIISLGQMKDDSATRSRQIVCVLKRQNTKEPKILYWHEN